MKNISFFVKFKSILLFIAVFFSNGLFAQKTEPPAKPRPIRYISAKKNPALTRPRISGFKNKAITREPAKEENKLRPDDHELEKTAFRLINEKRAEKGVKALVWNGKIAELARQHSQNMARFSFFSHIGLNGRTIDQRALDFGLTKWNAIGENIAYNKGIEKPADFAVERWMLSEVHCRNLLDTRWKESGIGLGITEDGYYFFTQIFIVKD
jgi:uncharacterized protein YkwD